MAGIFANVDSDIKKLQRLRNEIDNIKKALKGINVKVDIDIAKGLEGQLQELTTQYNALSLKVAETEKRITSSASRIIDASNKITQAQERLSKSSSQQSIPNNTQSSTGANNAETASVQAQAKAYEELNGQINGILGTREANIKRMLEEQNAIRLINEEIKKLEKLQGTSSSSSIQNRITQLNDSLLTHKAALSEVRQTLSNNAKLDNAAATSMNALSQSLSRMRIAYRDLTEEERNSPFGQQLLASIRQADAKIKSLDATIGNHQRNVGNYASGWNGLGMSIQQIGRELPSLAMGWNTFFLAISNNLPILADEIKRARVEYDNLRNAGQKATPVWKQVASSLLSWQTALTVGITLLTLYGDEIINWIGGLFGADSAQKKLNESIKEFNQTLQQGQTEARLLFDAVKRTEEGTQGRAEAIRRINEEYGKYLPNLLSERSSLNDLEEAYKTVTEAIKEHAAAKMQAQAIEEIAGESIKKQADALTKMRDISRGVLGEERSSSAMDIVQSLTEDFRKAGDSIEEAWRGVSAKLQYDFGAQTLPGSFYDTLEDYIKSIYDSNKEIEAIRERYNPFFNKKEADKALVQNKEHWEEVKRQAQSVLDSIESSTLEKLRAGNITGIPEAIVQKYKQAQKDIQKANKELASYDFSPKTNKKQKKTEFPSITVQDEDVTLITPEEIQESINLHREAMNQYLKDYGTYQEKRKAIADSYSMRIDEAKTEGERLYLQKKMEEELAGLDLERLKKGINWELIFGDLSHVTREELDKVRAQLEEFRLSKEYKNLSIDQKETVEKALNDIKSTMIDNGGLLGDLPARLDELREAQEELTAAQEAYNEALRDGTEWEQEAAMENLIAARNREANAQRGVSDATKKTIQNITTLTNVIAKLGSSSEMSMTDMGNMVEQVASLFGEMGSKVGGLIGAALSLIDVIQKQGMENFVMNISKMGNDLARETMEFFTFGLLDLGGLSNRNVDSDVERLTTSNNELVAALDRLRERMDDASVADSTGIYNLQTENLRQQERNYRQMMQEYGSVHDDGFLGMFGSHSSFYKVDEEMSANEWRRISGIVGKTIDSAGDFFNLTSEQMALVADNATDLYAKIKQYADDGVRDAAQYMDDYIQIYKELEELQDAYNEKLTSVSFDTVRDDFRNALLNMEDDTEAFAESFENMMQKAILESMMTGTYDKKLRDWYNSFSSAMEGGELTPEEQKNLKQQWDNIVNQASEEWENWKKVMGWDSESSSVSTQEVSRGGYETMSQDSADELNGRFTALQMSGETIASLTQQQLDVLYKIYASMGGEAASPQETVKESFQQQAARTDINMMPVTNAINEVKSIVDEMRTRQAEDSLTRQESSENLQNIVQRIRHMQRDTAEVKQNTSRI